MSSPLQLPDDPCCFYCGRNVVEETKAREACGEFVGKTWVWKRQFQPVPSDIMHQIRANTWGNTGLLNRDVDPSYNCVYILEERAYICIDCFDDHYRELMKLVGWKGQQ